MEGDKPEIGSTSITGRTIVELLLHSGPGGRRAGPYFQGLLLGLEDESIIPAPAKSFLKDEDGPERNQRTNS